MPRRLHESLRARRGRGYLEWPGEGPGIDAVAGDEALIRLVTSFATTDDEVRTFVAAAEATPAALG